MQKKNKGIWKSIISLRPEYLWRKKYISYIEKKPLKENVILIDGAEEEYPTGNVAAILFELCLNVEYKEFEIYYAAGKRVKKGCREAIGKKSKDNKPIVIASSSKKYYKILATAKYLVSEVSFPPFFIKREGQKYLNTWHGTPLKKMGKSAAEGFWEIGNVQKNFCDADYLLCPNEYTRDIFINDYMLANIACNTKVLLTGYPRNELLLKKTDREKFAGHGKKICVYMPTWREDTRNTEKNNDRFISILKEIDEKLDENMVFYMKLHPLSLKKVDLRSFKNIKSAPKCDIYELLSVADVLVTDYSSVFYDYAVTGKKTVLFNYDEDEYVRERGLYVGLDEFPFPKVQTADALIKEIYTEKSYDEATVRNKYCRYDKQGVTSAICEKFLFEKNSELIRVENIPDNKKENVVLFIGAFQRNGLTSAAFNLLNNLDLSKRNYFVIYCINEMEGNKERIKELPKGVNYFGYFRSLCAKPLQMIPYLMWGAFGRPDYRLFYKSFEKIFEREAKRIFGNRRVDTAVQYTGYSREMIGTFDKIRANRIIFVHSDMEQEIRYRKNSSRTLLSHAYKSYDTVAVLTDGVTLPVENISRAVKRRKDEHEVNIKVCPDIIDVKRIREGGEKELILDDKVSVNGGKDRLYRALESDSVKFVQVGRFSVEKGQIRLIEAFEKVHKENNNTVLIIIGSFGPLYDRIMKRVNSSVCSESIFVVKSTSDPYPLIKKCDCLISASYYEGFGLTIAEADILGLSCFATDCNGTASFMKKYGGVLVENSVKGIENGMKMYLEGKVPSKLNIDYELYNKEALNEFEKIL